MGFAKNEAQRCSLSCDLLWELASSLTGGVEHALPVEKDCCKPRSYPRHDGAGS